MKPAKSNPSTPAASSTTPPITLEHTRLRALAKRLGGLHANDAELLGLASALMRIGKGADANKALGVKRSKGHDDKKARAHLWTQIAIRWIAGRLNSEVVIDSEGRLVPELEKPPTRAAAIVEAARLYGLNLENLQRACPSIEKLSHLTNFDWDGQRPLLNKPRD